MPKAKQDTSDDFGFERFSAFFSMPNMDGTMFSDGINKNVETAMAVGKAYFDGSKEIIAKQVDLAKDHMQDMVQLGADLNANKLSESGMKSGLDAMQAAGQRNMQGMKDIAEATTSMHQNALKILQERYQTGLEEVSGQSK